MNPPQPISSQDHNTPDGRTGVGSDRAEVRGRGASALEHPPAGANGNAAVEVVRETDSAASTMRFAALLGQRLQPGDVVALSGDLGAGKTCFVRGLARGLGLSDRAVSSPTFVLVQEYEPTAGSGSNDGRTPTPLVHIDAYRMQGLDELETIGWEEFIRRRETVIAVEWAERISDGLPGDRVEVEIEHAADAAAAAAATEPATEHAVESTRRRILVRGIGAAAAAVRNLSSALAAGAEGRLQTESNVGADVPAASAASTPTSPASGPGTSTLRCPICREPADASLRYGPFCSRRCQLVDLGRWMGGQYVTSRPIDDPFNSDEDEGSGA